jgi:hypothetical protein
MRNCKSPDSTTAPPPRPTCSRKPLTTLLRCLEILIAIAFFLFVFNLNGKRIPYADAAAVPWVTLSLLKEGNLDVNEYPFIKGYFTRESSEAIVNAYGIGMSIVAIPFLYPLSKQKDFPLVKLDNASKLCASTVCAVALGLFLSTLLALRVKRPIAYAVCIAAGLGTTIHSLASQELWSHGFVLLFWIVCVRLLLLRRINLVAFLLIGIFSGMAILCRNLSVLLFLPIFAWLAFRHPLPSLLMALGLLLTVLNQFSFNLHYFGGIGTTPYGANIMWLGGNPAEVLPALLISPNRGLLISSTFLLLGMIFAIVIFLRNLKRKRWRRAFFVAIGFCAIVYLIWLGIPAFRDATQWDIQKQTLLQKIGIVLRSPLLFIGLLLSLTMRWAKACRVAVPLIALASALAYLGFMSIWEVWSGGYGYGSRLLTEIVLPLSLLLAVGWQTLKKRFRRLLWVPFIPLALWSIFNHSLFVHYHTDTWNIKHMYHLQDASWFWFDPQLFYHLQVACQRYGWSEQKLEKLHPNYLMKPRLEGSQGLLGVYYPNPIFEGPGRLRLDKTINFSWADKGPFRHFPSDFFTVRWTGQINAPTDGEYQFQLTSDDASLLEIDGKTIVDNGGEHTPIPKSGTVELKSGWHEIKLEFKEVALGATMILKWIEPGKTQFVLIPPSHLRPPRSFNDPLQ